MSRSSINLMLILAAAAFLFAPVLGAPAAPSDFVKQNGLDAQKLNAQFATLNASDACNEGQQACVEQAFAQCVSGKWELTKCAAGTVCTALPLVNSAGTSLACDSEADAIARMQAAGVDASLTGNGNATAASAPALGSDASGTPTATSDAPVASATPSDDGDDCSDDGDDDTTDSNSSSTDGGDDEDCEGDDDTSGSAAGVQSTATADATSASAVSSVVPTTQPSATAAANSLGAATPSPSASADSDGYAYAASSPSGASQFRSVAPAATTIALNRREAFPPVHIVVPHIKLPPIPSVRRYMHRAGQLVRRQSVAQTPAVSAAGVASPSAAIIELTSSLPTSFVSASGAVSPGLPSAPTSVPVITPSVVVPSSGGVVTVTIVSTITVFAPAAPTSAPFVPVASGTAAPSGLPAFSSPVAVSAATSSPAFIGIPPSSTPASPSVSVSTPAVISTPVFGGVTSLAAAASSVVPSSPVSAVIPTATVQPSSVFFSPSPAITPTALPVDPIIPTNSAAFLSMLTAAI